MNSPRTPFRLFAALGLLLVATGCASESEADHRHPKISHDVTLTPARPTAAYAMELGAQLKLFLPVSPPGYDWSIVSNNVRVLEQTTALAPTAAEKAAGLAPAPVVTFYSLKPGRSILRFALLRPTDRDAIPTEHFEVTVLVKEDE